MFINILFYPILILAALIIIGMLIEYYEKPFLSLPDEILGTNPQVLSGFIFASIFVWSIWKTFSIYKINSSSNEKDFTHNNVTGQYSHIRLKFSYPGRIIYTILSFEMVFFFYNNVIQSILLFPGPISDMENKFLKIIFYLFF